jgi:hypothetical protein
MDVAFEGEVGVLGVSPLPAAVKMNGGRFQTFQTQRAFHH